MIKPAIYVGKLRISVSFLLICTALYVLNPDSYFFILILSALIHEAGHLIAAKAFSQKIESVEISLSGAQITLADRLSTSYGKDAIIALSGAAANIAAALTAFVLLRLRAVSEPLMGRSEELFFILFANAAFAAVNLIPISGLDGGNALFALIASKIELEKAEKIMKILSIILSVALVAGSFFILKSVGYNFSMLVLSVSLLLDLIPRRL